MLCHRWRCFIGGVFLEFFFFKQKTAYELRISDWSSDVCSSDLLSQVVFRPLCPLCGEGAEEPAEAVLGPGEAWCRLQDSNPRPPDYKSGALPTELSRLIAGGGPARTGAR